MSHVDIGSQRISYDMAGHGPPVLLLHGFFCDRSAWRTQLAGLSDEFTVVTPDLPGCGESSDPPEQFPMSAYASCLLAFIRRLGFDRPNVVGLSLGSVVAQELYRLQPKLPAKLVLASAYAGWHGSLPADVVQQRLDMTIGQTYLPAEQWVGNWVKGLLSESAPAHLAELVATMVSRFHPVGARAMTRAGAEADTRDVLPKIKVPTLLIYGDKDVRSPLTVAHEIHRLIPASKLVVIPGVGHLCNVEAPDRFNAEVRRFLHA
jgi:pimeloyl-ACP methyl ester carboxylesterase